MNEERMKSFGNIAELITYLQDCERESEMILEAKRRRPLRRDDQLFRQTFVIEGMAFWYSIILREDGDIEFWVKRYTDEDIDEWGGICEDDLDDEDVDGLNHENLVPLENGGVRGWRNMVDTFTTHKGFTLATILHLKKGEEPLLSPP